MASVGLMLARVLMSKMSGSMHEAVSAEDSMDKGGAYCLEISQYQHNIASLFTHYFLVESVEEHPIVRAPGILPLLQSLIYTLCGHIHPFLVERRDRWKMGRWLRHCRRNLDCTGILKSISGQ
jgi:hypothetical protein